MGSKIIAAILEEATQTQAWSDSWEDDSWHEDSWSDGDLGHADDYIDYS